MTDKDLAQKTADELVLLLRVAKERSRRAFQRTEAARRWLDLCQNEATVAGNLIRSIQNAFDKLGDPPRSTGSIGDIWKRYGIHDSQLVDGLPQVDPSTVDPIPTESE